MTRTTLKTALDVRLASRAGELKAPTAGLCPAHVQANLLIIPKKYAEDFRGLCKRNPVSCPLLGENIAHGNPQIDPSLAKDGDVTTDAPGYNVYLDGKPVAEDQLDCKEWWTEDSVAFLIGCSFTFEQALTDAGLMPRHQELGKNVPMYKSNIALFPSGIFSGNMVVSMRPYPLEDIERVRDITRPYIQAHGEPVAWGKDAAKRLGISDIYKPDFGDAPVLKEGEVPVFWGCGVTPQLVAMSSPDLKGIAIGHAPGKMLCLDLLIKDMDQ
ncbi:hypothetical protein I302_100011 [Kwoniella bestiolae CBS 10118]|uniref:DUF1445 domain-containing protein n=1 Tax=Kwoniella bestiolae CBS 10118 TaxID=1296100 RepID=A0A1B9G3Y8_9TREE|nr:hypothetical protein I302_03383 [Kwoniella bestiolae CBS 10118]OCF25710.1 hypothetical protein I302_03383 [Kwoniella bestiolae CBS 10118]